MSLGVYEFDEDNSTFEALSIDGLQTRPVQYTHDGTNGEIVETKLYLRNDDANFYYTNISLQTVPGRKVRVGDLNFPEAFIGFKIIVQDGQPTESEWLSVESGNEADFADIGSASAGDISYVPFWTQVNIPVGTRVQTVNDVAIHLESEQNAV